MASESHAIPAALGPEIPEIDSKTFLFVPATICAAHPLGLFPKNFVLSITGSLGSESVRLLFKKNTRVLMAKSEGFVRSN